MTFTAAKPGQLSLEHRCLRGKGVRAGGTLHSSHCRTQDTATRAITPFAALLMHSRTL